MVQAAVLDGQFLDLFSPFDDRGVTPEVGVSGSDVANALMITLVVVMFDEGADLVFEIARQIVVLQQDAVLQGLMPSFDLALSLRMIRRAPDVPHLGTVRPNQLEPGRALHRPSTTSAPCTPKARAFP